MDENTKAIYKRGALVVVPAFVIAILYMGLRMWVLTRPPKIDFTLDTDAIARDFVAYCDQIGWDAEPCASATVAEDAGADR